MSKEEFDVDEYLGDPCDKYNENEYLAKQAACTSTVSQSITYPNG